MAKPPHLWTITVGDRRVSIAAQLLKANKKPIDLTGKTVKFRMTPENSNTPKIDDQAAVIDDVLLGKVSYPWTTGDVDTKGSFDYQWIIVEADGKTEHLPVGEQAKVIFVDPV